MVVSDVFLSAVLTDVFLSIAVANSFSSHAVADAVTSVAVSDVASSDVAVDSFVELPSVILVSVVWSSTIDTGYVLSLIHI